MATVTENPIILDLTLTYGCMLVGCLLSCAMWGVSSLQAFLYFAMYENDQRNKKLLIAVLWVIDTANQAVVLMSMWPVLIKHWGSLEGLSKIQPGLIHHAWIAQLLECSVQLYFIHRIYVFSGRAKLFPAIMMIPTVFQLVLLIPYDVIVYTGGAAAANLSTHKATSMVISLRAVSAAEDFILASVMMFLVLKNGLPDFHKTRQLVVRLVVVTANTGLWTAVVTFVELILVAKFPNGLQFCVVEFPLCSLYFSSLLASLNARDYVRGDVNMVHSDMPSKFTTSRNGTGKTSAGDTLYLQSFTVGGKTAGGKSGLDEESIPGDHVIVNVEETKTRHHF